MKIQFSKAKEKMDMGEGTRVEIDLVDILSENEGILVGDSAKGFICVLAETRETNTYPPRPFRVNAGAIHLELQMRSNFLLNTRDSDRQSDYARDVSLILLDSCTKQSCCLRHIYRTYSASQSCAVQASHDQMQHNCNKCTSGAASCGGGTIA